MTRSTQTRLLYGGAITASLSKEFKDVSDLRPFPDHQEVFLNDHEVSIISELLDLGHDQSDDMALQYYFNDLANNNESQHSLVLSELMVNNDELFMPGIGASHSRMILIGKQSVKKYRSETSPLHDVYIVMTLVRLRNVATDVLLTFNLPSTVLAVRNISVEVFEGALTTEILLPANTTLAGINDIEESQQSIVNAIPELQQYREFLHSFRVNDWQLFGGQ